MRRKARRSSAADEADRFERPPRAELPLRYMLPLVHRFMMFQNGGESRVGRNHRTKERTCGRTTYPSLAFTLWERWKGYSLAVISVRQFWIDEWGYPPIGVYFATCPSAGHDMICPRLQRMRPQRGDRDDRPIDQEWDLQGRGPWPENFEAFIRGLEDDSAFDKMPNQALYLAAAVEQTSVRHPASAGVLPRYPCVVRFRVCCGIPAVRVE